MNYLIMFTCYMCGYCAIDTTLLCSHLRGHESAGELIYPIHCTQSGCTSTFQTVWNFGRHLKKFHSLYPMASSAPRKSGASSKGKLPCSDVGVLNESETPVAKKICLSDVQSSGVSLVAALHANSAVPTSVITDVVSAMNDMSECVYRIQKVSSRIVNSGIMHQWQHIF